ncbi:hypothetical protein GOP47_0000502 [Adiantum capillus-veneris]|uniref:FAD-binding FR-type domain-containing protein n=1 Tax=Adiantum capillus-veneris TaxID=13818 RepID=A0A9D4VF35_ADICA|nr:hypothetical protein GOP47_0000502 [Adiantum capillus-veneris]
MAVHSTAAFASPELCNKTLQGSLLPTANTCFKPREGFLCLNRSLSRYASPQRHRNLSSVVVAATDTEVSEDVKTEGTKTDDFLTRIYRLPSMQSMIDPQPFTISSVDEGGVKDWHPATVLSVVEVAAGVRRIVIEAEISREMVSIENAYTAAGRLAQLKVNGGTVVKVVASSPPFSLRANEPVLVKARGDIPSGMTKQAQYYLSVKHPLELLVYEAETPQVFSLKEGDEVELGPFNFDGLDLRPVMFLTRYPTLLFFASGKGIAIAKAIIEARDNDVGSMNLGRRVDIRLFYWSPDPSKVLFKDKFEVWENEKLKVRPAVGALEGQDWDGHVGTFMSLWDDDDIEYDPSTTGVIVCVDSMAKAEVDKLLADAGIPEKQFCKGDLSAAGITKLVSAWHLSAGNIGAHILPVKDLL